MSPESQKSLWESLQVNALATLAARLLTPTLSLVLVVVIARLGGAARLGQYTLLITIFVLCENIKSLGLPALTVREIAAKGPEALGYYSGLVRLGLFGALISAPAMVLILRFMAGHSPELLWAAALLSLALFPSAYALAGDAMFLGIGRATYSLWVSVTENVLRLVGSLLAVLVFHGGLLALSAVYVFTRCLAAIAQRILIRHVLGSGLPGPNHAVLREMVSKVPSFFLIFIAPLALLRLDILILGFVQGDTAVGIYSAAMRFLTVCLIVPDGIMTASFALLSKLSGADTTDRFDVLVQKTIAWLGAGLMPISVLLALLASFVTSLLFGGKFVSAVSPARTLAWALVPFAVNRALGDAMVARGFQRTVAKIILSNFLVAVALYVSFIWLWGVDGAAWAFYSSILLFCFISVGCAIRKASLRPYTELAFSLFPAMICSLIFALSKSTMVCSITGVLASGLALIPAFRLLDRPFHSTTIECSSLSVETK